MAKKSGHRAAHIPVPYNSQRITQNLSRFWDLEVGDVHTEFFVTGYVLGAVCGKDRAPIRYSSAKFPCRALKRPQNMGFEGRR